MQYRKLLACCTNKILFHKFLFWNSGPGIAVLGIPIPGRNVYEEFHRFIRNIPATGIREEIEFKKNEKKFNEKVNLKKKIKPHGQYRDKSILGLFNQKR